MSATPTAFRLRVFAEPPPLFLGLRGTPLSISWRVPAGRTGNLCPVISQKTMTGRRWTGGSTGENSLCLKEPDALLGTGADPARARASGGREDWRPAGGAGSPPAFLRGTPERPQTVPGGKRAWSLGHARASLAADAPSYLPQVLR